MTSQHPSLTQFFDAPDGYCGHFAWVCGYSADAAFLNDALERFTRETKAARAVRGQVRLALMLDPGHPAITAVDVPGLAHLPLRSLSEKPFRLMHAKVALLGYRHESGDGRWLIRLLVSTGNWTRQTLEESLDLAWCIEVDSQSTDRDQDLAQRRTDIAAAWQMVAWLREFFDLRLLEAGLAQHGLSALNAHHDVDKWLASCIKKTDCKPRFVHNRSRSLLSQLPEAVQRLFPKPAPARNYLAMGSGFFEPESASQAIPSVLTTLVSQLQQHDLLTPSACVNLFVNPAACQGVAGALQTIREEGWTVWSASPMEPLFGRNARRALHAKFLFSAGKRSGSDNCLRPWVYLGSGNLTGPGFLCKSSAKGNLEAGVIFAPGAMQWSREAERSVQRFLPVHRDEQLKLEQSASLSTGEGMPEVEGYFLAAPIAWFQWLPNAEGGFLQASGSADDLAGCEVLDLDGQPCVRDENRWTWPGMRPRQVQLRWQVDDEFMRSEVPVMDEFGRLAAAALTALEFNDAWWALADFPGITSVDEDGGDSGPDDDNDRDPANASAKGTSATTQASGYPIRQMMELLERIAERQTAIGASDWMAWCTRLEQTLSRVTGSPVIGYFQALGLNPLSPLRAPGFRPDYALDAHSVAGVHYEHMLARVERDWQVNELAAITGVDA